MHEPTHPQCHFTRRTFVRLMAAGGLLTRSDALSVPARAQTDGAAYSYPMGFPGRPLGDGLLVRHGYATENTWYNPGWLYPQRASAYGRPGASWLPSAVCDPWPTPEPVPDWR